MSLTLACCVLLGLIATPHLCLADSDTLKALEGGSQCPPGPATAAFMQLFKCARPGAFEDLFTDGQKFRVVRSGTQSPRSEVLARLSGHAAADFEPGVVLENISGQSGQSSFQTEARLGFVVGFRPVGRKVLVQACALDGDQVTGRLAEARLSGTDLLLVGLELDGLAHVLVIQMVKTEQTHVETERQAFRARSSSTRVPVSKPVILRVAPPPKSAACWDRPRSNPAR